MTRQYQICTRCVMDTSVADIRFDGAGVCNYCAEFLTHSHHVLNRSDADRAKALEEFTARVKASGRGRQYDCIIGVSGGVDSSWALVTAVRLGLRPLAVHMDNGWNSELAQNNIANLVRGLGVDLHTHVIEWQEYRRLMQAFFDADVVDVELLYDNAMMAVNYEQATRYGLKYILAGSNQSTEGMRMPSGGNWFKYDRKNIAALGKKFGGVKLRTFPAIGTLRFAYLEFVRGVHWIPFLDYLDYKKADALEVLQREYGYKPYLFKHYESVFTRFYQGYILPRKFGVDKRRVHLGTLVASGQMSRDEALRQLEGIPYASQQALEEDRVYFIKKMHWTPAQLDEYIARPPRPHMDYPSEKPLWDLIFAPHGSGAVHSFLKRIYRTIVRRPHVRT
jgi:N-acetyl sugar amidotransferase